MYEKADQGQARTGRHEAQRETTFRAEVQPHLAALRRSIARLVPSEAVEDIVQEALMAAWRHAESLAHVEKSGAWLMAIGRRKAIDWLRREGRVIPCEPLEIAEPVTDLQRSPEGELARQQGLALVRDAVASLPPRQQAVISLRALEERDVRETAMILSMAEKTVYATESSARERLKQSSSFRSAWAILSSVGTVVWMLCARSKQLLAQSVGWFKAATQVSGWAKTSAVLWTGTVGAASLAGLVALGSRPDVSEGLSRKLSVSPKGAISLSAVASSKDELPASFFTPTKPPVRSRIRLKSKRTEKQSVGRASVTLGGIKVMNKKATLAMVTLAAGLLVSGLAEAGDKTTKSVAITTRSNDVIRYHKITKLDFEGSTLRGNIEKPMGTYFEGRRRLKMKSLIRFRKNFRERMTAAAASL